MISILVSIHAVSRVRLDSNDRKSFDGSHFVLCIQHSAEGGRKVRRDTHTPQVPIHTHDCVVFRLHPVKGLPLLRCTSPQTGQCSETPLALVPLLFVRSRVCSTPKTQAWDEAEQGQGYIEQAAQLRAAARGGAVAQCGAVAASARRAGASPYEPS